MTRRADALVIGAGPAGAAIAILLARAGWEVILVEQDPYPRGKVCGECIAAGSLSLLDELDVGAGLRAHGGPELRLLAWMSERPTLIADFPICATGPYRFGRALRREHLDQLLVERAIAQGVVLHQPAKVRSVRAEAGGFQCEIESDHAAQRLTVHAATVIDAHGSWQRGPDVSGVDQRDTSRRRHRASDLFGFKAVFRHTTLTPGLLAVMALPGGYGGMVIADQGLATLACCLRRDTLSLCRTIQPRRPVGDAVESYLREGCVGVREALEGAQRAGPWLAVGPLLSGVQRPAAGALFSVGNAAGETHPLVGEGIGMALQSATLLADELTRESPAMITARVALNVQRRYRIALHQAFSRRRRLAALYAHIAMRPHLARPARALFGRWPTLLTEAARLAGKARSSPTPLSLRFKHEHT